MSLDHLNIREASVADAEQLATLAKETFWDAFHTHPANKPKDMAAYMDAAFSVEQISSEISRPDNIYLIAESNGEAAGFARLITGSTEQGITAERPIELNRLYTHQRFLGSGIGQKLMDRCFNIARENGYDTIWLGVWEHNPRAKRFYEKNGFSYCGTHVFQLGFDPQTDLLMQREL